MTFGLVVRPGIEEARALGAKVLGWASDKFPMLLLDPETCEIAKQVKIPGLKYEACSREDLSSRCDLITTLGGDGTFISVARHVGERNPLLVGVNFGTLGFLTEISPSELLEVLESVQAGKAKIGTRQMIRTLAVRDDKEIFSSQAVNDAVVIKGAHDKLMMVDLAVDDEPVMSLRGDGLILASPTGSTAYSLAAGGSIAAPSLEVLLVTPICPHSLTSRPLVLPSACSIQITIPEYSGRVFLSVDGQESLQLESGDKVYVSKASRSVRYVTSPNHSYFEILRNKLNWGISNRGD